MKWEQSVEVETVEYICFVKKINGVITQKIPERELIRCQDCKHYNGDHSYCENDFWALEHGYCNWAEREE